MRYHQEKSYRTDRLYLKLLRIFRWKNKRKEESIRNIFKFGNAFNLPRMWEQGAEGGINRFPGRSIVKGGADTQEEHINRSVVALLMGQEGYLETADARMINFEEDEVSGEDNDESSREGVERGGAKVDIGRDDKDNVEDAMTVDLRAEHLRGCESTAADMHEKY